MLGYNHLPLMYHFNAFSEYPLKHYETTLSTCICKSYACQSKLNIFDNTCLYVNTILSMFPTSFKGIIGMIFY